MNIALLTGRGGSKSITKKNVMPVLGRPLATYPILSALNATKIDKVYISTDCSDLKALAREYGVTVIERPEEISGDRSELAHALEHALKTIGTEVEYLVSLHCNCGTHRPGLIDACLETLEHNPEADACVTGLVDKSVHPYRTRQVTEDGRLLPWSDIPQTTSSNRQTMTPCFLLDGAARAMRVSSCFPLRGPQPFPYLGEHTLFVENDGGLDIHSPEDVLLTEVYLRRHGFSENSLPQAWRAE